MSYLAKCTKCGGDHFYMAEFRQYRGGTYSSAPGGELMATGPVAEVRICLCGQPVASPKRLSLTPDLRMSLGESLEKALRFRQATELETIQRGLQEEFASKAELVSAIVHLTTLAKVVEQAEKEKEKQTTETQAAPSPPSIEEP
jgi:hypothetical protein